MYEAAGADPARIYIGVDANGRALEKVSERIHRKPKVPNAAFVQAAVESLPAELDGVAAEVTVQFPWGSLLRGVAVGEPAVMANLRRICAPGAVLDVTIGLDPARDRVEMERLGVEPLMPEFVEGVLARRYRAAGFVLSGYGVLGPGEWQRIQTSWARRLRAGGAGRTVTRLRATAS